MTGAKTATEFHGIPISTDGALKRHMKTVAVTSNLIQKAVTTSDWGEIITKLKAQIPTDAELYRFAHGSVFVTGILGCKPGAHTGYIDDPFNMAPSVDWADYWQMGVCSKEFPDTQMDAFPRPSIFIS